MSLRGVKVALVEVVTVTSRGRITIPSRVRRELKIVEGDKLLLIREGNAIKLIPVPRLSRMAGIDRLLFKGREPSKEIEEMRGEWMREFERRVKTLTEEEFAVQL